MNETLRTDHSALKEILLAKQPKGRIARWISKLNELDYTVVHVAGKKIPHADALSRLPIEDPESTERTELADVPVATEDVEPAGAPTVFVAEERVLVGEDEKQAVLELYHDSPHSGGHEGVWRTYLKVAKRFSWPQMRKDVEAYVKSSDVCQRCKAKFRPKPDAMVILPDVSPMHTIHLDFAELEKKREGVARTKSFLIAIDRNIRFAFAKAGKENAKTVIQLLSQKGFVGIKKVVSDQAKVFESRELRKWADERGIEVQTGSPYHPASNGLSERLIRDLKMYISLFPDFPGGWKCALEAAVKHHNRSHCKSIGCSPEFALSGRPPILQADKDLGIVDRIVLKEERGVEKERLAKLRQKRNFDKRHPQNFARVREGDMILVRAGLSPNNKKFGGPFVVTKVESFEGIPKRYFYEAQGIQKQASVSNVVPYFPRRVKD